MNVDFSIFASTTVLSVYNADMNPLHYPDFPPPTTPRLGYSPYFNIKFQNNSTPASGYNTQEFIWHFGDYYSDTLSITVTGLEEVEHTYIMPGKYVVSLTLKQKTEDEYIATEESNPNIVREENPLIPLKPINVTKTQQVIELKEILPQARIHAVNRPTFGNTPLILEFSPEFCKPGSFPLERIDWNFGDGTPTKIITRQPFLTSDPNVIYNNFIPHDPLDVRNYNIKHTFLRKTPHATTFYPSLTCYSFNTNSFDTCSTTVGPVFGILSPEEPLTILKTRNTIHGNLYSILVPPPAPPPQTPSQTPTPTVI